MYSICHAYHPCWQNFVTMYQGHLQRNLKTVRDRRLRCHNAKILAISHHPLVSHWSLEEPELSESVPTPHIRLQPERSECAQSVTTAQPQSQNVRMNSAQIRNQFGLSRDLLGIYVGLKWCSRTVVYNKKRKRSSTAAFHRVQRWQTHAFHQI